MAISYRLTYLPEGRTRRFSGMDDGSYCLDDGSEVALRGQPVWCGRCGEVTHGERIESVEEIDKRIADLERLAAEIRREVTRPPGPTPDAPGDRLQREQIADLRVRRAWRKGRRSPPRCLECGSVDIVPLEHGKPLRVRGGSILIEGASLCDPKYKHGKYSPEGERITDGPAGGGPVRSG